MMSMPARASAAQKSDVVVTCTTSTKPFLLPEHVRRGTFVAPACAVYRKAKDAAQVNRITLNS